MGKLGLRQPLNAVNVALRKLRAPRRLAKAIYRRLAAGPDPGDVELAQHRLNRVLATSDEKGNLRVNLI